jgi:hypothetical protein
VPHVYVSLLVWQKSAVPDTLVEYGVIVKVILVGSTLPEEQICCTTVTAMEFNALGLIET